MLTPKKLVLIAACAALALGVSTAELAQPTNRRHLRSLESAAAFSPGRVVGAVALAATQEEGDATASDDATTADGEKESTSPTTHGDSQDYEWVDEPPATFGAQVDEQEEDNAIEIEATTTAAATAADEAEDISEDRSEEDVPSGTSALTEEQANGPREQVFAAAVATDGGDADQEDSSEDSVESTDANGNDSVDNDSSDEQQVEATVEETSAAANEGDDQEDTANEGDGEEDIEVDAAQDLTIDIDIHDAI